MKFDPEAYSITIRKEEIDDEILYVGRVAEFPKVILPYLTGVCSRGF